MLAVIIVLVLAFLFWLSSYLVNKYIPERCNHDCAHCNLQKPKEEE